MKNRLWPLPIPLLFAAFVLTAYPASSSTAAERILVLSAASAAPAVAEIAGVFSRRTGIDVRVSSGSSGTLARQITRGAPADIYISASSSWIETLTNENRLDEKLTRPLLRNRLVIIGRIGDSTSGLLDLTKPIVFLNQLNDGRLAIGDPLHVPAGQYAQQALENLGLWPAVRDRLARQINVRAVLAFVERGESPLGIIYATDAALSNAAKIRAIIPSEVHDPIVYSAAVVAGRNRPDVRQFFNALGNSDANGVFEQYGFGVVRSDSDRQLSNTTPSIP